MINHPSIFVKAFFMVFCAMVECLFAQTTNNSFSELIHYQNIKEGIINLTTEKVREALDNGVQIDQVDQNGKNLLMYAIQYHASLDVIQLLISKSADLHVRDSRGYTALIYAAGWNNEPAVTKLLLDTGVAVDWPRDLEGRTPLMFAAWSSSSLLILQFLLEAGAQIDARTHYGDTPLIYAARNNPKEEIIDYLIQAGSEVDAREQFGNTPLMYASQYNENHKLIEILLNAGADFEKRNYNGRSPLILAIHGNDNHHVVQSLLEAGADNNSRQDLLGNTPLIFSAGIVTNPSIVQILIDSGSWVDVQRNDGVTALMEAATNSQSSEVLIILLKAGANPFIRDIQGRTAWDLIQRNKILKETPAYWKLHDLHFK